MDDKLQYITFYNGKLTIPKNISIADKKKFAGCIKSAYKIDRKFWGTDAPIKIKPIYSRSDFSREWGGTTRKWQCAFTSDKKVIVIFAPSVFGKLTNHKPSEYLQILIHEMNHIFYMDFVGATTPVWLLEGLAMYVSGQGKRYKGKSNGKYLRYSFTKKDLKESDEDARQYYRNSYLFTSILLKQKGKNTIIDFLKKYRKHRTKENYKALYKELFANKK